jgi:tripartite-type tricarboxylate transporter receptor subunit TctC
MRDFVTISGVNQSDLMMTVNPSLQASNLKEFIALAKSRPGQINYASSGLGTVYHMAGELLKSISSIEIVHVPHKASGDMRTSVVGGHVQMMFDAISVVTPMVRSGQLRALGTTGRQRTSVMPDLPTIAEGGAPGYETAIWFGLMAPTGTPKDVVEKLSAEVQKVLAHPEVKELWAKQGVAPMNMTAAELDKFLRDDIEKWAGVAKTTGLKLN